MRLGITQYTWEGVKKMLPDIGKRGMWGFQANFHEGHRKCAEAVQCCDWVVGILYNNMLPGFELKDSDIEAVRKYSDVCLILTGNYHPENYFAPYIIDEWERFTTETNITDRTALYSIGIRVLMHDIYGIKIDYQPQSLKDGWRTNGYAEYVKKRWGVNIDLLEPVRDNSGNSLSKTATQFNFTKKLLLPEFETMDDILEHVKDIQGLCVLKFNKDDNYINAQFCYKGKKFEEGMKWRLQ